MAKRSYPLLEQVEAGRGADEKGKTPSCSPAYACSYCPDLDCSPPGDPQSLLDTFRSAAETSPGAAALGWRPTVNGSAQPYAWKTYADAYKEASQIGAALHALGADRGAAVGIYSANSPEWMLAMKGIDYCGARCVPLYDTFGPDAIKFIIRHSGAKVIFCSTVNWDALSEALPDIKGQLTQVVVWSAGTNAPSADDTANSDVAQSCGVPVVTWEQMLGFGQRSPVDPTPGKLDDLCTIMYTSGTTGDPKGVEITHRAVLTSVGALAKLLQHLDLRVGTEDVFLSYLPLAHIFDRVAEELFLTVGARIAYWQGSPKTLMDDVSIAKPTIFVGVPRIFDRVYSKVTEKVNKSGVVAKALFQTGCFLKNQALRFGITEVPGVDHLIFHKIKAQLGGRVRVIVSGGAPLAGHVEHFLKLTMCCPVTQGYGLTETCAASFIANPYDATQASTVGAPVPGLLARLESIPDMGYDAQRDPPQGELLIKGAAVFQGYHRREDLTNEALDSDGWFHTGDIAEMLPKGALKIVDRKKNLLKLSHGEYVATEKLENQFKKSSLVDQVWVHGDSTKSALVAVVVPDAGALASWAKEHGKSSDMQELCGDEEAADHVQQQLEKEGRSSGLKGFEIVKKVHLTADEFSVENDLITPSFKLKRPQLKKRFAKEIEQMYQALGL